MAGDLETLARWVQATTNAVALTGAGVSTESGIPDFRGDSGLWQGVDPARVASIDGFLSDPEGFYRFWGDKFSALAEARPNVAHRVLAALEQRGHVKAVVTQNIDGLHQKAGSERVYEVHGTFQRGRCLGCGVPYGLDQMFAQQGSQPVPRCSACGQLLKPDVVLFGEMLPPAFQEGGGEVDGSELLLVLGSSLEVFPVADLVPRAKAAGARVVLLNRDPSAFDRQADLVVHGELGALMEELRRNLAVEV